MSTVDRAAYPFGGSNLGRKSLIESCGTCPAGRWRRREAAVAGASRKWRSSGQIGRRVTYGQRGCGELARGGGSAWNWQRQLSGGVRLRRGGSSGVGWTSCGDGRGRSNELVFNMRLGTSGGPLVVARRSGTSEAMAAAACADAEE